MSFNDRAADRQSHSHPVRFGRIKRFEEPFHLLGFETGACVLHAEQDRGHSIAGFAACTNDQDSLRLLDCVHRIHSIDHQVEENLLRSGARSAFDRPFRRGVQKVETGIGIVDDGGKRLVDLMGDRGRQFAHGRQARRMSEFRLRLMQFTFSPLSFGVLRPQGLVGFLEFPAVTARSSRARLRDSVALFWAAASNPTNDADTAKRTRRGSSFKFGASECVGGRK